MSVYFVYRSHYEGPSGKHVRRLEGDSVLGWFQSAWERAKQAGDIRKWVEAELGCKVYGFATIFEAARDESLPPPSSDRKLESYLDEHLYVEGELKYRPHVMQVLTDDDEIELAYFFFDDHFLEANPGRADYLLHEDWRLPTTAGDRPHLPRVATNELAPRGPGAGRTFLVFLAFYDSLNLTDLEDCAAPSRIEGVRIPGLADYLARTEPGEDWPFELKLLRSRLALAPPGGDRLTAALEGAGRLPVSQLSDTGAHSQMGMGTIEEARDRLEKALEEVSKKKLKRDHDPSRAKVSVGDHIAQLCVPVGWEDEMYHQWILFDDLWAGAHPDLARGILTYARRWDALGGPAS